jgi:hypothetical protein
LGFAAGDNNLYRYTSNNSLNYSDPLGQEDFKTLVLRLGDKDFKTREKALRDLQVIYLLSPPSTKLLYIKYQKDYIKQKDFDPEIARRLETAFPPPYVPPPPTLGQTLMNIIKGIFK